LTTFVYAYKGIGSSSVVYIFHKGIISLVLCGYEVQMNSICFILSESPSLMHIISFFNSSVHLSVSSRH